MRGETAKAEIASLDTPSELTAMLCEDARNKGFRFGEKAFRPRLLPGSTEFEPHLNCIGFTRYILSILGSVDGLHPDIRVLVLDQYIEVDRVEPYHASVAVVNTQRDQCSRIEMNKCGPRSVPVKLGQDKQPYRAVSNLLGAYAHSPEATAHPHSWQFGPMGDIGFGGSVPSTIEQQEAQEFVLTTAGEEAFRWEPIIKGYNIP